ncbi:MAG: S-layer homology domain-containing protein [Leptolyngbyaceae cyanobacterium]
MFKQVIAGLVGTATLSTVWGAFSLADAQTQNLTFSDTSNHVYAEEIELAADLGLIAGPGDGTFRPNSTLTREQAAAIIATFLGYTDAENGNLKSCFRDVPAGRWSESQIAYLADFDIIAGRGNGLFDPTATVTRAELMAMTRQLFGGADVGTPTFNFSDISGHWAADSIRYMASLCGGIARPVNEAGQAFQPSTGATRGYTAAVMARTAYCGEFAAGDLPAGTSATRPPETPEEPSTPTAQASLPEATSTLSQVEVVALLEAHNRYRAEVGVAPLTWSTQLATSAQTWANGLVFEHSEAGATRLTNTGENLAVDIGDTSPLAVMVDRWAREKNNNYIPGIPFAEARSQATGVIGHYTQIVWRDTTEVGCGFATGTLRGGNGSLLFPNFPESQSGRYLVCQYSPPGNFLNQVPY